MSQITVEFLDVPYNFSGDDEDEEKIIRCTSLVKDYIDKIHDRDKDAILQDLAIEVAVTIAGMYYSTYDELQSLKRDIEALRNRKTELEDDLASRNKENQVLTKTIENNRDKAERIENIQKDCEEQLAASDKKLKEMEEIANKFQNQIYHLQLKLEEKKQQEK